MKNKYIVLSLFTAFLMAGCANDGNDDGTAGYLLSVQSVSINGVATRTSSALAADGATIGVSTLSEGAVTGSNAYSYSTASGKWAKASGTSGLVAAAGSYLCAYYPYNSSITDKTAILLTSAMYSTAADLSYAYSTAVTQEPYYETSYTTFFLQHAYSKLTFNFSHDSDYMLSKAVNSVTISNPGILSSAALDITKSTAVYNNKVASDVTFNAGISDIDVTTQASVLMVPTGVLTGNITVQIQVGGDYKQLSIPASLFANSKLEAGVNYCVSVNLTNTGILDLGTGANKYVTISDWTTTAAVSGTVMTAQPESNCYMVAPGCSVLIPVSRATAGNATNFPSGNSFTTGLLWSDVSDNHVTASAVGRYIKVTAGSAEGNSVVYAKNAKGDIVWSWHIWVTKYSPATTANTGNTTTTYIYNSNLWMDRNLGAITAKAATQSTKGLLYQWGRKDPFPSSTTYNGSIEPTLFGEKTAVVKEAVAASPNLVNSIQNPLTFYFKAGTPSDWYSNTATQNDALWYNGTSTKTIYDPCPVGWRVPYFTGTTSPWNGLTASAGTWNAGYSWMGTPNIGYYPAAGYWYNIYGTLGDVGGSGYYWSATVNDTFAYCMTFYSGKVDPSNYFNRAYGFSVRCVKN